MLDPSFSNHVSSFWMIHRQSKRYAICFSFKVSSINFILSDLQLWCIKFYTNISFNNVPRDKVFGFHILISIFP